MIFANKEVYSGDFFDGSMEGVGTYTHSDGST